MNPRTLLILAGLVAALAVLPCAAPPAAADSTLSSVTIARRAYYPLTQVAAKLGMRCRVSGDTCELIAKDNRKLVFTHDKRKAVINGIAVTLDFAAVKRGNQFYISVSDYSHLLNPLYNKSCLKGKRPRIIVIDPGHGGKDQGAAGAASLEKHLALSISRRLRDQLRKRGYTVYLIRETDVKVELADRAAKARKLKADIFISIHMNAAKSSQVRGVETYSITPKGAPSSGDTKASMSYCRGYAMTDNSAALAFSVQSEIIRTLKLTDRGVKRARFKVLTENTAPSILVECGFISNAADEALLRNSRHQEKLAEAIANGVDKYARRLPVK